MLHGAGYDPAAAEALQAGGMDPEDLRRRLLVPPGEPGSLAITHGLSPETSAKGSPPPPLPRGMRTRRLSMPSSFKRLARAVRRRSASA